MKKFIPKSYLQVLRNRDFFLLSVVILIGQIASAFLVLSMIVSVFSRTNSNFGVSGIVLSFTIPALILMIFSGITADIFNRKKIIVASNTFIALVVFLIILTEKLTFTLIPLSFLYFAGNSFFIPASSAATAQLVKKDQLLAANSIFIAVLAGGVVGGFLIGSIVNFFLGNGVLLLLCEALLVFAVVISVFLPNLYPISKKVNTVNESFKNILSGFSYIFSERLIWLYFVMFAGLQSVILFGVTVGPGFYDEILGISIDKSPMIIFPFIGLGSVIGMYLIHNLKFSEINFIRFGVLVMGISMLFFGIVLKFGGMHQASRLVFNIPFLTLLGFGSIMIMIAARTGLQKIVSHSHLGTVFGANIVLASFLATFMSPMAVVFEVLFGYLGILVLGGAGFIFLYFMVSFLTSKWR